MNLNTRYPHLHVIDHPLVQHKLSIMRSRNCPTKDFRQLLREISLLVGYELTRDFPLTRRHIETPVAPMEAPFLSGKKVVIVPVLRAGLGMTDGLLELIPSARVGHIGLYRDENKQPVEYLVRMPKHLEDRTCIITDPMVATGGSAVHAVDVLLKRGVSESNIRFMSLVSAPEGLDFFFRAHPSIDLYTCAVDEKLNENAYIVPGLGDAGDRIFGTVG
ncbi:uracil phosphoribosyltransferase [Mesosutterella sp. OilRF-GAM-744-9]|uniref:Uracil phosphoribosyltransferase n=2 Tax=Mesosutterella TaxID=2494213 RepID=A0ABS9MP16_9BURK|nr:MULTISPECIES: uracil phosphoribosyltransferase [unclassified Mesosutterella]MCG5030356.1 uracil phosphoribosyltransferase [Mesosutterella sp. oilRF-744-WT-GAM-9]MDL2059070.1 uracil phosphoribosyltransferase [Mesosutterella sp. AGMB02718]